MNKERREQVREAIRLLRRAKDIVEATLMDEQITLDNIPENLQGSARYSAIEDAIDSLDSAVASMSEADDYLDSVI